MLRRDGIAMQLMPGRHGCELAVYKGGGVVTEEFRSFSQALKKADRLSRLKTRKRLSSRRGSKR